MQAMILKQLVDLRKNKNPLIFEDYPDPTPTEDEILLKISACGVCHTELDEIEGRTPPPELPIILGHQVVGRVEQVGKNTKSFLIGDRVGVAWIYSSCGQCMFCLNGNENLCTQFRATGRDAHGGYAQFMTVKESYAYLIPEIFSDYEAAPLLCAGAIGYRSINLTNLKDGEKLGLTGFGASAHLVLMMAKYKFPNTPIFVFARSEKERDFALQLGAVWAGNTDDRAPDKLNSIIDTTPVWKPIVEALSNLESGGRLIINAIRKEEIDKMSLQVLDYPNHLWMEKEIKSVANVSRGDVKEFLKLAAEIPIRPEYQEFELKEANRALMELKERKIRGAKVLRII
jgi:propanol-preferring alcohol dehydrogenase